MTFIAMKSEDEEGRESLNGSPRSIDPAGRDGGVRPGYVSERQQEQGMKRSTSNTSASRPRSPRLEPVEDPEASSIHRTITQDFGRHDGQAFSSPKRVRTEPLSRTRDRPTLGARKTTLLSGMKRSRSGLQRPRLGRADTFSYQFKEAPLSESESSSSGESEDEESLAKEKIDTDDEVHPADQTDGLNQSRTDDETKKARRRYAYSRFTIGNDLFKTKGRVSRKDGRLKISINETANSGYIAKALGQSIRNHLDIPARDRSKKDRGHYRKHKDDETLSPTTPTLPPSPPIPKLNIVIMVIGSRGDIQPFVRLGQILRHTHGHRVRIASHPVFRSFVEDDGGLDFFSVGGDPSELMAFMVKNPGLIPNMQTLREGEIGRRRAAMAEMFEGFWRACINSAANETDEGNAKSIHAMDPFVADAIIANPPSMAHVHIAEKLGVPLHMMFTFPYSPTTAFPHPLANIKTRRSNVDGDYVNFMSYPLVEMMTWQGLGDIVNRFREETLGLEPVSALWAPGALYRMKAPYTYMWSPSLVPKPRDWGPEIDIGGFVFLDLAGNFKPPKELTDFLDAGEMPVYIGFGSIVVDDPDKFTEMIFKATEKAGVRALVNKGWGGFGRSNADTPKHIFMLENTPHDWLFPRVKAVVHHGGAGTTAIGLKCARPTMIVPFFGDQPFWGAMVAEAKAGAFECIPYKRLTVDRLAEGITQCLTPEAQENVQTIADSIATEGDGAENAVLSFHRSLPLAGRHSMRCSILQDRVAIWHARKSSLRLSALAAQVLHKEGKLKWGDLKLARHHEWNDFDGPGEPFTGGVGALTDSLYGIGEGFGMVPVRIARHIRKREEHERRKRAREKKRAERERRRLEETALAAQASKPSTTTTSSDNTLPSPNPPTRPPTHREQTSSTLASALSADPTTTLPGDVVDDFHWGLKRAGAAILTLPNDLHVAIAQGFHNAPRLYGDSTVRKPVKITGFRSGVLAARKEFCYGVYDAWTGLVRQPKGDWEDGEGWAGKLAGLGTGLGKGVGGFVIKNTNAVWAPPGFVVKGLIKYAQKRHQGPGSKAFLRRAQIVRGEREVEALQAAKSPSPPPSAEENIAPTPDTRDPPRSELHHLTTLIHSAWTAYATTPAAAHADFGAGGGAPVVGTSRSGKEQRAREVERTEIPGRESGGRVVGAGMSGERETKDGEGVEEQAQTAGEAMRTDGIRGKGVRTDVLGPRERAVTVA